jgi:hypothetical protein
MPKKREIITEYNNNINGRKWKKQLEDSKKEGKGL